jgi:uncharacterized protein
MINIGQHNTLSIKRESPHGIYLVDKEDNEVLLPNRYVPENPTPGDEIEVFIYKDSEDRIVATTQTPFIAINDFAVLKVLNQTKFGAFVDWGLEKHLLIPFSEQHSDLKEGKNYLVRLYLDEETKRLVATTKIGRYLSNEDLDIQLNEEVKIIPFEETSLGFKVMINRSYLGLVYHNEIFKEFTIGETYKAYVSNIREDNKIDITLQKSGYENNDIYVQKILDLLEKSMGFLPYTDKTEAELIKEKLEMSKKNFKKAIGKLYKDKQIIIKEDGIYSV